MHTQQNIKMGTHERTILIFYNEGFSILCLGWKGVTG